MNCTEQFDKPGWLALPDDSDYVDRDAGDRDQDGHADDQGVDVEGEQDQEGDDEDEGDRNSETYLKV